MAVGMLRWPYGHACGGPLMMYLVAIFMVNVMGLWGLVLSWRRRMGWAHAVSMLVLRWGWALAGSTVLPRIGYSKQAATWFCP